VTEDEVDRADILAKLDNLRATAQADARQADLKTIEGPWKRLWPFLSRTQYMLIAPEPDPALCAGPASSDEPACARDWDEVLAAAASQ
jgi:hypothetical protein